MASPYNNILFKAEDAIEARINTIIGSLAGMKAYKGGANDEMTLPFIAIVAESAQERPPRGNGNFTIGTRVEIHTSADDASRVDRKAYVAKVGDALSTPTLAADLSSDVADFKVFGVLTESHSQRVEGRTHIYSIDLQIHGCSSDV